MNGGLDEEDMIMHSVVVILVKTQRLADSVSACTAA
jgi:hypothetical protein